MFDTMNLAILIAAGLVAISALTSLILQRIGTPLLLVFLGFGLLAGEDGLLQIEFDSGGAAYFIGSLALAIILFDSGFATPLRSYRLAAAPALTLATLGVVLTTGLLGVAAHLTFGIDWVRSLLLGAIIASTDAAAVFFLLRAGGITIRDRVRATLEIESGANDPMAIFLTATLVEFASIEGATEPIVPLALVGQFVVQIGLGLALGVAGGVGIVWFLRLLRRVDAGLYPIGALAAGLVIFSATGLAGGSGFVAAYVAGAIAGNSRVPFNFRIARFQVGTSWLAQIGMFLTLGLLATPSEFGVVLLPAVGLALALIFIARPVAVWLCLMPFGFSMRETAFIGWVGLRGAVSILLAILPTLGGVPGGSIFFNTVFIMVLASLIIQGWTIPFAARRLRLLAPPAPGLVDRVAVELPGEAEVELVGYRIHPDSAVAGGRVPRWARPLLILRGGRTFSVHDAGALQPGDRVYLFASPRQSRLLDRVYTRPADLADREVYGDFALKPATTIGELEREYGFLLGLAPAIALGDHLTRAFHGRPAPGDRLSLGPVELIVRSLDDEGQVAEIGMALQPATRPRLRGWRGWSEWPFRLPSFWRGG
jgi:cell volume regulation protein A